MYPSRKQYTNIIILYATNPFKLTVCFFWQIQMQAPFEIFTSVFFREKVELEPQEGVQKPLPVVV